MKTKGYLNERREAERLLSEEAGRNDAIVGIVFLAACLAYAVARYFGFVE